MKPPCKTISRTLQRFNASTLQLSAVLCALCLSALKSSATTNVYSALRFTGTPNNRTVTFSLASDPLQIGTNIVFGTPLTVQPTNGVFSINLLPANYWMRIDQVTTPLFIPVPDSTNTYSLWDLAQYGLKHLIRQTNYVIIDTTSPPWVRTNETRLFDTEFGSTSLRTAGLIVTDTGLVAPSAKIYGDDGLILSGSGAPGITADNGSFTLDRAGNITFAGKITGDGSLLSNLPGGSGAGGTNTLRPGGGIKIGTNVLGSDYTAYLDTNVVRSLASNTFTLKSAFASDVSTNTLNAANLTNTVPAGTLPGYLSALSTGNGTSLTNLNRTNATFYSTGDTNIITIIGAGYAPANGTYYLTNQLNTWTNGNGNGYAISLHLIAGPLGNFNIVSNAALTFSSADYRSGGNNIALAHVSVWTEVGRTGPPLASCFGIPGIVAVGLATGNGGGLTNINTLGLINTVPETRLPHSYSNSLTASNGLNVVGGIGVTNFLNIDGPVTNQWMTLSNNIITIGALGGILFGDYFHYRTIGGAAYILNLNNRGRTSMGQMLLSHGDVDIEEQDQGEIVLGNDGSGGGMIRIRFDDRFNVNLTTNGPGNSHVLVFQARTKDNLGGVHDAYPAIVAFHTGDPVDSFSADPQGSYNPSSAGELAFYTHTPWGQTAGLLLGDSREIFRMRTNGVEFFYPPILPTNATPPVSTTVIKAWVNVKLPNGTTWKMPLYQ